MLSPRKIRQQDTPTPIIFTDSEHAQICGIQPKRVALWETCWNLAKNARQKQFRMAGRRFGDVLPPENTSKSAGICHISANLWESWLTGVLCWSLDESTERAIALMRQERCAGQRRPIFMASKQAASSQKYCWTMSLVAGHVYQ